MYDLIIIGGGPAGLSAAIYARMANKSVLVLEKTFVGGQLSTIFKLKNYPGFEEIDGITLSANMKAQVKKLGATIANEEVKSVDLTGEIKIVDTYKNHYEAKGVIIAAGGYARPLEVENEKSWLGRGLSYCATCDGNFFKDKIVAVVGGGNTSFEDCLYLSGLAKKVYLVHRRDQFTGHAANLEKIKAMSVGENAKIEIIPNTVVTALSGKDTLEKASLLNKVTGKTTDLNVDGIFVAIGRKPDTELYANQITFDAGGFIKTDEKMHTNLSHVYAAGDVRNTPLRQIVTACADGAIAATTFIAES